MNQTNQDQPYRLAFVDLDDTLFGPDKQISPDNLGALARLRGAGVQIAFASGRHHFNITSLERVAARDWVLSSNGSMVRHQATGEVLSELTIPRDLAAHLFQRSRELGLTLLAYNREGAYVEQESDWTTLYARGAGWQPQRVDFSTLPPDGFLKVLWSDHPARIAQLAPAMQAEFAGRLNVLITNPELLEFFSPTANKAAGAQALISRLGLAPAQTLAFGDGNNDVELLQWAGLSVAMHHGRPAAHRAARFVSPPGPPESAFARAVDLALTTAK